MRKMNASTEKGHNRKHNKAQFPQGTKKGKFHQNITLYLPDHTSLPRRQQPSRPPE
jgi:hypothetical protein